MDRTTALLIVIAGSMLAIAVKMWMPGHTTLGDMQAIGKIQDSDARERARQAAVSRMLILRVQGGSIDVDVSGGRLTVDMVPQ